MAVKVIGVSPDSVANFYGIQPGTLLISINNHEINDVLDYQFYAADNSLKIELSTGTLNITKADYEDLGLIFDSYLMDNKRSCQNNCIFCFISQLPKGMRETLYFKDDDARLSFLQGNYITLTNISEKEVQRIIKMRLPINVSVHTTNPKLRIKMLGNKNGGKSLQYLRQIAKAGNAINCQTVICKGINDGEELKSTLHELISLYPSVKSIACVPAGITQFRDGLYPLEKFTADSAASVIDIIDSFGDKMAKEFGDRLVYPGDEFFLMAGRKIPPSEYYGDYPQYENGVGFWRNMYDEFMYAVSETNADTKAYPKKSLATGILALPLMSRLAALANPNIKVFGIRNNFFGETITVAGLVVGRDIIQQLKGQTLGRELLIPKAMLRAGEDVFLDDLSIKDVERALSVKVICVDNDGYELFYAMINNDLEEI